MEMKGRIIKRGVAEGAAIVTQNPLAIGLGGIDPDTGDIIEKGHELAGQNVKGKVLVFSFGKGSTVSSYFLYRMKKNGVAPAGIINRECETIVAVGAIISDIPCVDHIDISKIKTGDSVKIDGESVIIEAK